MFYTAKVISNVDENKTGIIEVYVPAIMTSQKNGVVEPENASIENKFNILNSDINANELKKINIERRNTIPAHPHNFSSKNHGFQLIPEIGDEVTVFFKDNNYDVAYYMYANTYQNGLKMEYAELIEDKENYDIPAKIPDHKVLLLTKSQHIIAMNDTKESNGIIIKSAGKHKIKLEKNDNYSGFILETENGHKIMIDDSNDGLLIASKAGHSFLIDDKEDGINIKTKNDFRLTLDSKNKLIQIVTPAGIGLEFDDNNNKLKIAAMDVENKTKNNFEVDATKDISLKSKANYNIETAAYKLKASTSTEIDGGDMQVKANALKIEVSGSVDIKANGSCNVEGQTCKIKGTSVTVDGTSISLGEGATEALLKTNTFLTIYNTHTHATPTGPSGPPVVPLDPSVLSTTVKAK